MGKTKDVIELTGNKTGIVRLINKPAITAGDGERKETLERKDVWATTTTVNIFSLLDKFDIINHFWKQDSPNSFLAIGCDMIPLEVVIRREIGKKSSYLNRNPEVKPGIVFSNLVVEFFLKDDLRHDPILVIKNGKWLIYDPKLPISDESCLDEIDQLCTDSEMNGMEETARLVFSLLEQALAIKHVKLEDLKIEFGRALCGGRIGKIMLADVIDNDSWRIIDKNGNDISKQLFRDNAGKKAISSAYEFVAELSEYLPGLATEITMYKANK